MSTVLRDRVIFADLMRMIIGLAVVICVTVLGWQKVLDATAVTGILGAVVGAGAASQGAAIGGRAAHLGTGDETSGR